MKKERNITGKLKSFIVKNHILLENFTSLSLLQFIRVIIPLILLPKLISSLGLELYGTVIYAQTIVAFFMIIVNFGFDMSGTKQVAIHKEDKLKVSEIVFSITTAKVILLLLSTIAYLIIIYYFQSLWEYRTLYLLSFLFCLQEIMIPVWLFQGLEKMRFITIVDVVSRFIYLILIYSFVSSEADYLLVPAFRFFGVLIAGVISFYIIIAKEKIGFNPTSIKKIKFYLNDSRPFFFSKLSAVINDRTNTLILGIVIGMTSVAYYDFVYKIVATINAIYGTFIRVLYPRISITKNKRIVKKIFIYMLLISGASYLLMSLFSRQIILILASPEMLPAQSYFYYLGLSIPLVLVGWTIGDLCLAAFGHSKVYSNSSIFSSILYFVLLALIYQFSSITIMSLILALLARLAIIDIYRLYYCRKYSIL